MTHPVDAHVGQRLRDRRTLLGISQEALAKSSGITFQQIQKYERASNRISVSRIFEFAEMLKVPVNYFFEGLSDESPFQLAEEATGFEHQTLTNDADLQELVSAYRKIEDPEMRKSVKTLVLGIANGAPFV